MDELLMQWVKVPHTTNHWCRLKKPGNTVQSLAVEGANGVSQSASTIHRTRCSFPRVVHQCRSLEGADSS